MADIKPPEKVYKYRTFNAHTLRSLNNAEAYYANPEEFNDPLDSNPSIHIDTDSRSLENLCRKMLVAAYGEDRAKNAMESHRYWASEDACQTAGDERELYMKKLAGEVRGLLGKEFCDWGVFSLAARWDCPLMWSHYANQHQGVCIEYEFTGHADKRMGAVSYDQPRSVSVSDLIAWKIDGSEEAKDLIWNTYFFRKAPDWQYEQEWRGIGKRGVQYAPMRINGLYFGLRCDIAVKATVVKLCGGAAWPIEFFEMYPRDESFGLARVVVDVSEVEASAMRQPAHMDFKDVVIDQGNG